MKRIVVGLDGSPRQEGVLAAAVDLARRQEARLLLVRAVSIPVDVPTAVYSVEPDAVAPLLVENAKKELERLKAVVPPAQLEGIRVIIGTPWRTLCDVAREVEASVLVIGSHGYGGLDRLLGTTAARVVNHAACSVLVVR
jgi:nucleotide-binding universal stress UspA family protein